MKIARDVLQKHVEFAAEGQVIFREGEIGNVMYILLEGEVEIRKSTSAETSKTLTRLHKGDIFGEMALIDDKSRSATAVAAATCKLLVMNEHLFMSMIEQNPDFAKKMIRILSDRVRKSNIVIQSLITTKRRSQVYTALQEYSDREGIKSFKGMRVRIKDFADWASQQLGIAADEITTTVKDLVRNGIVHRSAVSGEEILVSKNQLID